LDIESANHGKHKVNIKHGMTFLSKQERRKFRLTVSPVVYRTPDEAKQTFDYIVCAHKAVDPGKFPPLFKSVTDDNTTFVIIQNGVGNEDPFRQLYPKCTIVSCVTWVGAIQKTPGIITHTENEDTMIGLFPNPALDENLEHERLQKFTRLMTNGGTKFSVVENVQIQRWEKVVWNAAWNRELNEP
jgi:ketopantoate reductase